MDKLFAYALLGACVALGFRAVEWLVPEPERRIVVCMNSDTGQGICRSLADVDAAHKSGQPAFTKDYP